MARFDVDPNPSGNGYLLDVQSDLLSNLNTRLAVPFLFNSSAPKPAKRLNPTFVFNRETLVMMTQFMAAVPVAILNTEFGRITIAIEMVMQEF